MTPELSPSRSTREGARAVAQIVIAAIGALFLGIGVFANQRWLDRHFLPSFFLSRHAYVILETLARIGFGIAGAALAIPVRAPLARFITRTPLRALQLVLAAALGIVASELVLRYVHLRPAEWLGRDQEPHRQADAHLGWTFVPSRTGHTTMGGREIDYTFDAEGYRVRRAGDSIDRARPTILFAGESVMFGKGLTWDESVPAQVGALMRLQSANLAVDGFGTDQAYMRLGAELPRFAKPVAVVSIFMTALFGRNLDDDRPHLGPGLVWLPGIQHGRVRSLLQLVAPYRSDTTVERGIEVTREIFRATIDLARARGAAPLILVPQFGTEDRVEETLRRRILDEPAFPYVYVPLDPSWRVPGDVHPNANAARVLADAVAKRLAVMISPPTT